MEQKASDTWSGMQSPSFSCDDKLNSVETLICKKDSYSLKGLDNKYAWYDLLYAEFGDYTSDNLMKKQEWLQTRNSCDDKECIKKAYEERIKKLKAALITNQKENKPGCLSNPWKKAFSQAAHYDKPIDSISITSGGGESRYDIDGNNQWDLQLHINPNPCSATNCWYNVYLIVEVNGCFEAIPVSINRSYAQSHLDLDPRIFKAYEKGPFVEGFKVMVSYDVSGCAGGSGTKRFDGLNKNTLQYDYFASIKYECGKETSINIRDLSKK
ncbi:hypothetical protein [Pleionea sediminis]|uniref:hypothetical protein n=1 Tax=Pleionea sediminis TaxID=2569479 RepID=UPI0011867680|nr:hypothetical protein [Pleionea sediminis]